MCAEPFLNDGQRLIKVAELAMGVRQRHKSPAPRIQFRLVQFF